MRKLLCLIVTVATMLAMCTTMSFALSDPIDSVWLSCAEDCIVEGPVAYTASDFNAWCYANGSSERLTPTSLKYMGTDGEVTNLTGGNQYKLEVVIDKGQADAFDDSVKSNFKFFDTTVNSQLVTLSQDKSKLTATIFFTAQIKKSVKSIAVTGLDVPETATIGAAVEPQYSDDLVIKVDGEINTDNFSAHRLENFEVIDGSSYDTDYNGKHWKYIQDSVYEAGKTYGCGVSIKMFNEVSSPYYYVIDGNTKFSVNGREYKLAGGNTFVRSSNSIGGCIVNFGTLDKEGNYSGGDFDEVTPTPSSGDKSSAGIKTGVNTGDSNDIVLFSIMGILALAGLGFTYKRREN